MKAYNKFSVLIVLSFLSFAAFTQQTENILVSPKGDTVTLKPIPLLEINAKIAAMAIIAIPISPRNVPAPREIGVSDPSKRTGSTIPIVTKITKRYKIEIIPHERNIPRGIFRPGFLHSSATLQILVKPPNEIKIRPAVENIELNPCGAKLSKLDGLIKKNPATI